jgi:N6-adenosine-specific RNA methylase IME4
LPSSLSARKTTRNASVTEAKTGRRGIRNMTTKVTVSVNGNHKVAVRRTVVSDASRLGPEIVSGRGHEGPKVQDFDLYQGEMIEIGPEEPDEGEAQGGD